MNRFVDQLVKASPDGCIVRDRDGVVLACNASAARLLGHEDHTALIGICLDAVTSALSQEKWQSADAAIRDNPRSVVSFTISAAGSDGARRYIGVRQHAVDIGETDDLWVSSMRETTRDFAYRAQLAVRERMEHMLIGLASEFVNRSSREIENAFSRVLATIGEETGAVAALFFSYQSSRRQLDLQATWSADGDTASLEAAMATVSVRDAAWWESIMQDEPRLRDGVFVDSNAAGWRYHAPFPIRSQHETLGLLVFGYPDGSIVSRFEGTVELLEVVGYLFANVLVRREIEKLLNEYSMNLERMVQERTQDLNVAYETLKQTQSQLVQAGKMASIGQLAAGIAHEINNPVGFVKSNLHSLGETVRILRQRGCGQSEDLLEEIDEIIVDSTEGLRRIDSIVKNLRTFSRMDGGQTALANVNELIDTTLSVINNEIKYKATVRREYGELPEIYCSRDRLNQVFVNILVNAAQAIETHGEITIRTGYDEERVLVEISDTGSGIREEDIERIFDPFFTTKDIGDGTGLGLSIVYDIIKAHKGTIAVDSTVGQGTTFTISLPINPSMVKSAIMDTAFSDM